MVFFSFPFTGDMAEEADSHLATNNEVPSQLSFVQLKHSSVSCSLWDLHISPFTWLWTCSCTSKPLWSKRPKTKHRIWGTASPLPSAGSDCFHSPADSTILETDRMALGHLGGHWLMVSQRSQVPLCWAALIPNSPKPLVLHDIVFTQGQNLFYEEMCFYSTTWFNYFVGVCSFLNPTLFRIVGLSLKIYIYMMKLLRQTLES